MASNLEQHDKVLLAIGVIYAFNINPDNQYVIKSKKSVADADRLQRFVRAWNNLLTELSISNIEYYLHMEASEPYKGTESATAQFSRLHWHGYIRFPNVESLRWFHLYGASLLTHSSTFCIKPITDPDMWYGYVHKQDFLKWPVLGDPGDLDRKGKTSQSSSHLPVCPLSDGLIPPEGGTAPTSETNLNTMINPLKQLKTSPINRSKQNASKTKTRRRKKPRQDQDD